jgi:hypothetical protein
MARYGITRVPADMFHYGEYRYARLSDAVAQARRDADAALEGSAIAARNRHP